VTEININFPPLSDVKLKRKYCFYDMIAVDIFGYRIVKRDAEMLERSNQIKMETQRKDGDFPLVYAEISSYVDSIWFNFSNETPAEYKTISEWWDMVISGKGVSECYMFYIDNVPNPVHNLIYDAVQDAHKIWKPSTEKAKPSETDTITNPN
jgi:hypothetical protein